MYVKKKKEMAALVADELLYGRGKGMLAPTADVSRAESVTLLTRMLSRLDQK